MKKHYDFSQGKRNPYAKRLKQQLTIRLDTDTVAYFRTLAKETAIPYQTLMNPYLRDCAQSRRRLRFAWPAQRTSRAKVTAVGVSPRRFRPLQRIYKSAGRRPLLSPQPRGRTVGVNRAFGALQRAGHEAGGHGAGSARAACGNFARRSVAGIQKVAIKRRFDRSIQMKLCCKES